MIKIVTFKCDKCGKDHVFKIGARDMATLQDALDNVPERDADKLLEAVNRMLMNKTEVQRTAFMMNNADTLSMINYDVCGPAINLFDAETIKKHYSAYNQAQIDKLNQSMALWEDVRCGEGFVAFDAIFYCRKCKQLKQGLYLKVRSVEDKKERVYIYNQKCETCANELVLINDANMGYLFEGTVARAPCPSCGGKLTVSNVKFMPKF